MTEHFGRGELRPFPLPGHPGVMLLGMPFDGAVIDLSMCLP